MAVSAADKSLQLSALLFTDVIHAVTAVRVVWCPLNAVSLRLKAVLLLL